MMTPWTMQGTVPEITVHDLKKKLDAGEPVFLLDVRQQWENQQAALPDSTLSPLNRLAGEIDGLRPSIPAGAQVVVYCHHGMRSLSGAALLIQAGVPNVCSLAGGIDAWSAAVDPSVPRY